MKSIDEKVDQLLLGSDLPKHKKQHKIKTQKTLATVGGIFIIGLVISSLGFANTFSWFAVESTTINMETLFTWDGENAEDLTVTKQINDACGGNIYTFNHYLNLSANAVGNRTASFSWGNIPDGIMVNLTVDGNPVNYCVVEPGESIHLVETITLDEKLVSDCYSFNLTLS